MTEWKQSMFREGASIWTQSEDANLKPKQLVLCPGPTYGINRSMVLTEGQRLTASQLYSLEALIKQLTLPAHHWGGLKRCIVCGQGRMNADPGCPIDAHLGAFVYCSQHVRVHATGWCTVNVEDKIALEGSTLEEAAADAKTKGLIE